MKLSIVDYSLSNLYSVKNVCDKLGYKAKIISNPEEVIQSDAIILPGVGAFGQAMDMLNQLYLTDAIREFVGSGKPLLGICLGMQLLFSSSEEFGNNKGLDIIEGKIKRFPSNSKRKIPQISWNRIEYPNGVNSWKTSIFKDLNSGDFMYFIHSYYAEPKRDQDILSTTFYDGFGYCSSIINKNVFATQFHPEKSGKKGLSIYKNWLKSI